jgi:mono/diheme cytochrome c family protein
MKKQMWLLMLVLVVGAVVISACGSATPVADRPVPADFAGKTNPVASDAAAIEAGKTIYTDNCATCHGDAGKGDGPGGASLSPKPANLVTLLPTKQDDFVYWVISEGGAAAGKSASMVAWNGTLSEEEIWQVIAYARTLK